MHYTKIKYLYKYWYNVTPSDWDLNEQRDSMKSKTKRMFSGKPTYHKFDIARGQLETAIRLFLIDGADMFSAIALAANAGDLFRGLVVRGGKKPFIDDIALLETKRNPGNTPPRYRLITHVHKVLFVGGLKHLDDRRREGDEVVDFDAEEAATKPFAGDGFKGIRGGGFLSTGT
jgi:hypothetical protein